VSSLLILASADPETLRSGLAWAAALTAEGADLILVFEGEALRRLVDGSLDQGASPEVDPPSALLEAVLSVPGNSARVCPTSLRALGLDPDGLASALAKKRVTLEALNQTVRAAKGDRWVRF